MEVQRSEALNAIPYIDDLIREYLAFRGFHHTLKAFDVEKRTDKMKNLQVDKLIEQLLSYVSSYDFQSMMELWSYLNETFFSHLDQQYLATVHGLEVSLKRYYMVFCIQNSKFEKLLEFLDIYGPQMDQKKEWDRWIALPYIKHPEQDPYFEPYFNKQWLENFLLSLHNFLAIVFNAIRMPRILAFNTERTLRKTLQNEIEHLKEEIYRVSSARDFEPSEQTDMNLASESDLSSSVTRDKPKQSAPIDTKKETTPLISTELKSFTAPNEDKLLETAYEQIPSAHFGVLVNEDVSSPGVTTERVFLGHAAPVTCCRFSSSGYNFASSSLDESVKIWSINPEGNSREATITCQTGVLSVAWQGQNDRLVVCGTSKGKIKVWNTESRRVVTDFSTETEYPRVFSIASSANLPYFMVSCADDTKKFGTVSMVNLRSLKLEKNILGDSQLSMVTTMQFNKAGTLLLTGTYDGFIRVYDTNTWNVALEWRAHKSAVASVKFGNSESFIISFGADGMIGRWNMGTKQMLNAMETYELACDSPWGLSVALSPDETHAIVSSNRPHSQIYKVSDCSLVYTIEGHAAQVVSVDWHPTQNTILTASYDCSIRLVRANLDSQSD